MTETLRASQLPERGQTTPDTARRQESNWWRVPPVDRRGFTVWLVAYAAMTAVAIAIGFLIVHRLGGVRAFDDRIERWLVHRRTDTWNSVTWVGSMIADAYVKVPAAAALCALFVWRWRRWTESALLAGALVLEVAVFTTASEVVGRGRPPIRQIDPVPPTGAFPSGHSAAAVAFYGAIAVIVCWHTRARLARALAIGSAFVVPILVGLSRMYRGMHHLTDVGVGLVIGIISLWITWRVVRAGPAMRADAGPPAP